MSRFPQIAPETATGLVTVTVFLTTGLLMGCSKDPAPGQQPAHPPGPPPVTAGPARKLPDDKAGVGIGRQAPKFTLKDQQGKERSLGDLLKAGKLAVVFFRSASW